MVPRNISFGKQLPRWSPLVFGVVGEVGIFHSFCNCISNTLLQVELFLVGVQLFRSGDKVTLSNKLGFTDLQNACFMEIS